VPATAHIADLVAWAPVRNLDETGFRISGKTEWLHTASTLALTHYRVSEKRCTLWKTLRGSIIAHDHFKPYFTLKGVGHALCNAHHLRELKELIEIEKEPWATKMSRLLLTTARAFKGAVEQGQGMVAERTSQRIVAVYEAIVRRGLAFHEQQPALKRRPGARGRTARRPGHNLLVRLRDFQTEVLRFLFDFAVPFTNNQAEQDIRMMKVEMKISGWFRTQSKSAHRPSKTSCFTLHALVNNDVLG
jgi:transposase